MRFAAGVTRRANSVLPSAPKRKPTEPEIDDWLEIVEREYRQRGLPPRFQVGPRSWPEDLAARLRARGYVEAGWTLVLTAPLDELSRVLEGAGRDGRHVTVELTDGWLRTWSTASGHVSPEEASVAGTILHGIGPPRVFVEEAVGSVRAAVGLGVVDGKWLGIQCLATLERFRRRGCARNALATLADWGAVMGARDAYLTVEQTNTPARRLYDNLGFKIRYAYSYLTLEDA